MSVGYFATLAGERGKVASANYEAARGWHQRANRLEKALNQANLRIEGLEYRLQKAEANNAAWQAHAKQLEEKIREWQQSAIESEAISRAKTAMIREDNGGNGPKEVFGEDRYNKEVEAKKEEVV